MSDAATLTWGIKQSLVAYIEKLEDGVIEVTRPVQRVGDDFVFLLDAAESDFDPEFGTGVLQFKGAVTFTGHWGGMRIQVDSPRLTLTAEGAELATQVASVFGPTTFHPFASVTLVRSDYELVGLVKLLPEGQQLMGPQYHVGQEMSPLTLTLGAQ